MPPVHVCAGCGNPIYGGVPFILVSDYADLQDHATSEYAGYMSRFVHDYLCLERYSRYRRKGLPGCPPNAVPPARRTGTIRGKRR